MTDAYGNDAATSTGTIADTTNDAASGAPQRAESAERLARPLVKLAKACGLSTSFIDQLGTLHRNQRRGLGRRASKALDVDASSDEAIQTFHDRTLRPKTANVCYHRPTIVATTGETDRPRP
ncbi:4-alpha-glucanotransferase [Bifidobacterium longum]|nr:hypothetical protein [Bifidobacterium longum]SDO70007.1 4-alpha-glucanotransferase [Bifidobacterium longum]